MLPSMLNTPSETISLMGASLASSKWEDSSSMSGKTTKHKLVRRIRQPFRILWEWEGSFPSHAPHTHTHTHTLMFVAELSSLCKTNAINDGGVVELI